jgi:hypothetical protein
MNQAQPISVREAHRTLRVHTESAITNAFSSMNRALGDLELQIRMKVDARFREQELILGTHSPNANSVDEFIHNLQRIDRALESFVAHADNLSHIKLTLARAAALASPQGNLAQLVSLPERSSNLHDEWASPNLSDQKEWAPPSSSHPRGSHSRRMAMPMMTPGLPLQVILLFLPENHLFSRYCTMSPGPNDRFHHRFLLTHFRLSVFL